MNWPGTRTFFKKLVAGWSEDSIADTAAALSYYGILALFPFLLFVVALVGLVLDPGKLHDLLNQLFGPLARELDFPVLDQVRSEH